MVLIIRARFGLFHLELLLYLQSLGRLVGGGGAALGWLLTFVAVYWLSYGGVGD